MLDRQNAPSNAAPAASPLEDQTPAAAPQEPVINVEEIPF